MCARSCPSPDTRCTFERSARWLRWCAGTAENRCCCGVDAGAMTSLGDVQRRKQRDRAVEHVVMRAPLGDALKVSCRCGCKSQARQMRVTAVCDNSISRAKLRVLQWVAPAGTDSSVLAITASTRTSSMLRGRRTRRFQQSVQPSFDKTSTPRRNRLRCDPLARSRHLVVKPSAQARA